MYFAVAGQIEVVAGGMGAELQPFHVVGQREVSSGLRLKDETFWLDTGYVGTENKFAEKECSQ